jgi:hypothetical protein
MTTKQEVVIKGNLDKMVRNIEGQQKEFETWINTVDITHDVVGRMKKEFKHITSGYDHISVEATGYVKDNEIIWDNMLSVWDKEEYRKAKQTVHYTILTEQTWEEIEERQYCEGTLEERYLYDTDDYFTTLRIRTEDRYNLITMTMLADFYNQYDIAVEERVSSIEDIRDTDYMNEWQEWLIKEGREETNYTDLNEIYESADEQYQSELMEYYEEVINDLKVDENYGRNNIQDVIQELEFQLMESSGLSSNEIEYTVEIE